MDKERLIELVTAEVMRMLENGGEEPEKVPECAPDAPRALLICLLYTSPLVDTMLRLMSTNNVTIQHYGPYFKGVFLFWHTFQE